MSGSTATARVQVTIEVTVGSTWGDNCQIGQVYRQAKEEAIRFLGGMPTGRIRVVGTPTVVAVAVEEPR